ncbi:MAG: hypothetical protein IJD42_01810 [Clostridia bacterium]|nr:hypothetical protein [Clostridia bacterium]
MKRSIILKIFSVIMVCLLMLSLASCGTPSYDDPTKISFKSALSYEYLKSLDGKPITINGYMATSSPVDGSFIYLMNLPYQSCPFCVPNTNELSNTMAVYPQGNKKFDYTNQAIKITGILEVSRNKETFFEDNFGYKFNFKIVDAYYDVLDESELGDKSLWTEIASSDIITDIYEMYDYLYFTTHWFTYTATFEQGKDYLYPSDAIYFITQDGAQFNYGYKSGYFDSLRSSVNSISETELNDLIENINKVEQLSKTAVSELQRGLNNTSVYKPVVKYSEEFKDNRTQYEYLSDELQKQYTALFAEFSEWMSSFEY